MRERGHHPPSIKINNFFKQKKNNKKQNKYVLNALRHVKNALQGTSIGLVRKYHALLSLVDTNLVQYTYTTIYQPLTKLCCVHFIYVGASHGTMHAVQM